MVGRNGPTYCQQKKEKVSGTRHKTSPLSGPNTPIVTRVPKFCQKDYNSSVTRGHK